jgi:5-methylcytosine-specific restriction endonuclease McrBC GTP-binding regulatory subunit McrB
LLGYFNPLTGRYVSTPFLDLLLRAREEADAAKAKNRTPDPFFAILDEMNLARVEHYFSDFLSALESDEPLQLHQESETEDTAPVPRSLQVPDNIFFTGTVNVDESTYMFSPKVLDRAFTLELNEVDLEGLSEPSISRDDPGLRLERFSGPLSFKKMSAAKSWSRFGNLLDGNLRRTALELNDLLTTEHRHFGYRVAGEIARFVELASEQSGDSASILRSAFDLALLQKVLPKLHGTQQELEEILNHLFRFAVLGRKWPTGAPDPVVHGWTVAGGVLVGDTIPVLPRFALKVWQMRRRLERQGFTSFIE